MAVMPSRLNQITNWEALATESGYSISRLAKLCSVSPRSLERHFAEAKGTTPREWMNEMRQRAALKLMADGASIKEAAYHLAYKQPSHFSREFKRFHGVPPSVIMQVGDQVSQTDMSCRVSA